LNKHPAGFKNPQGVFNQNIFKKMHTSKNKYQIFNIIKKGFYDTLAEIMKYKKMRFVEKQNFPKAKKYRDKELKFMGKSESLPDLFG